MKAGEPFDFEYWAKLQNDDPEKFEKERRLEIESFINSVDPDKRQRLECLQWRIDQERVKASNPLSSCVRISRMMMDSVFGDYGLRSALLGQIQGKGGKILSLKKKK